ncbi:ABC transporter permease subunit [Rhodobacter sphaeroides]|jgi:peptide/nickel transport system permease protein|uniref:ABC peptide/nickel/opine transporter, inner membrane subunit n=3 Tax=Cereibacter TaxID=1653176 RepID=Q3J6J1_CERS4|nr:MULTISPECIES: ABC transporter permease [Cereibacter]ABN75221.1 binding-protein-dependent transport systems inner membrane component [Cereibacter sphaeroides ATCC 17029]EKX58806.1 Dipeptide transport system permease protein DppB [Rhodobacter sp. AKP1]RDS97713.1 ABC transporter permease [Cereibacter sphaeroides f. sp. denitrificans]ABA77593.1 ABC peptide/nickel/opine transporter, inner membrane subunit [Cereibacter sphaeroides 2.4.1]ACM02696.1 Binding-protein-dependent transport systems inner
MFILRFLARRLGQGAIIIFLVSALIFTLLRVVPGDPVRLMVGGMAPDTLVEEIAAEMGLRDPIYVQFGRYMGKVLQGDLGESFVRPASGAAVGGASFDDATRGERAKVLDLIAETAPMTLQLAVLAMVFALMVGVPIGVWGGLYPGRLPDRLALYTSSLFVSLPNFWLGIVLALLLSVKLNLLPAIGYRGFSYTILPALVLAVEIAPFIIRTLTVSVAGVMGQTFIDIARVRGLSRNQIVFRHALKNSAVPLLNLLGVQFSMLLGGVLVIEFIFDYPGLGLLTINAVMQRDFPLIQGIAIVTAAVFVLINIAVDLLATAIDPRLDY